MQLPDKSCQIIEFLPQTQKLATTSGKSWIRHWTVAPLVAIPPPPLQTPSIEKSPYRDIQMNMKQEKIRTVVEVGIDI